MQGPTLCLIHGNPDRALELKETLQACASLDVSVVILFASAEDLSAIVNTETGAVIVSLDLSLDGNDGAGLSLAEDLRALHPALPIYLLTTRGADLKGSEALFEDVIHEAEFLTRCPVFAQRILRAMGRYGEALSERNRRYRELVTLRLQGSLAEDQESELASYRHDVELPVALMASEHAKTLDLSLQREEQLLDEFTLEIRDAFDRLSKTLPVQPPAGA